MEKMLLLLSCIHAISKSHLRCPQNLSQRHPFLSTATVILLLAHCWTSWFPASSLTFYRLFPHSSHNKLLETRKILGCSFAQDLPVSSHHTYDKIQAAPHSSWAFLPLQSPLFPGHILLTASSQGDFWLKHARLLLASLSWKPRHMASCAQCTCL